MNDEGLQEFVTIVRRRLEGNDRVNDRDADVIERVPYRELSSVQKNVIQYCSLPRSAREILEHIGYKYHPTHIATYIRPLLQMGYIEMLIPDKPNSSNQKYRKVEKK